MIQTYNLSCLPRNTKTRTSICDIPIDVISWVISFIAVFSPVLARVSKCWLALARARNTPQPSPVPYRLSDLVRMGHPDLVVYASFDTPFNVRQANGILIAAAEVGHDLLCSLAIARWGATRIDVIVRFAAKGNHEAVSRLFRSSPATEFNIMLREAAKNGHKDLCIQARGWGATDFNGMLREAAKSGHEDLCLQAWEWGAADVNSMLLAAAWGGHVSICRLAQGWGANNFDKVSEMATRTRQPVIYALAQQWQLSQVTD